MINHKLKLVTVVGISLFLGTGFTAESEKQLEVSEDTFKCLAEMSSAEGIAYFLDNILGNLEETIAVATSTDGGTFPAGSVVSLVPNEAMVKHEAGWNPATNDWEFFLLGISEEGTTIMSRGGMEVANQAGSCMGCHTLAQPQWDLICSINHGCAPIPFNREQIAAVQQRDPRCRD